MAILSCSAVLAHIILRERLHIFGILGCVLCVVGSTSIVLHAPQEREIESVTEVWDLAMDPGDCLSTHVLLHLSFTCNNSSFIMYTCLMLNDKFFFLAAFLLYAALVITAVFILVFHFIPQYGQTHIMVYIGICSLVGSLSVCLAA